MKVTGKKHKRILPTEYPKCLVSPEGCGILYPMLISSFIQTLPVLLYLLTWLCSTFVPPALISQALFRISSPFTFSAQPIYF